MNEDTKNLCLIKNLKFSFCILQRSFQPLIKRNQGYKKRRITTDHMNASKQKKIEVQIGNLLTIPTNNKKEFSGQCNPVQETNSQ